MHSDAKIIVLEGISREAICDFKVQFIKYNTSKTYIVYGHGLNKIYNEEYLESVSESECYEILDVIYVYLHNLKKVINDIENSNKLFIFEDGFTQITFSLMTLRAKFTKHSNVVNIIGDVFQEQFGTKFDLTSKIKYVKCIFIDSLLTFDKFPKNTKDEFKSMYQRYIGSTLLYPEPTMMSFDINKNKWVLFCRYEIEMRMLNEKINYIRGS